jgi:hypothetical protein
MGSDASSLVALPCALCGLPVCHYDPTIIGSRVGGLCSRTSCRTDPRNGMRRQVYTFAIVVGWPAYAGTSSEASADQTAPETAPALVTERSGLH